MALKDVVPDNEKYGLNGLNAQEDNQTTDYIDEQLNINPGPNYRCSNKRMVIGEGRGRNTAPIDAVAKRS